MIDLRRKTARRRENTVGLKRPVSKNVLQNSVTRCRSVRTLNSKTASAVDAESSASTFSRGWSPSWDVVGYSFLRNRASCNTSKVEMDSNSISKTVPRCFLSCEAETARDTHLRAMSSLATATIRRRLRYIRTRRTSPSRHRQELNPQIQEGTPRVETTRVLNAEAQVEYRSQIADEREAAMCNRHAKQRDVQRNEPSENQ